MPATMQPRQKRQVQSKAKTQQWRKFKGINRTDARTAIDDDELFWLENVLPVGNGALQLVPRHADPVGPTINGPATTTGGTLNGTPVMLVVKSDGSIVQVNAGGVQTVVAPAATVTVAAKMTTYQGTRFLIIDPVKGYMTWDGTTFAVIDAARLGVAIAVFEGRVWIANNRTLTFTAPSTYQDFTAANGSGSTLITDDAFQGNVVALTSALEQLWIVGQSALNAISNVQASGTAPNVVTTFSNTNIVTNLGTNSPTSVIAYFRALTLLAPFGAYALSGVTPNRLSDKLDGFFDAITFSDAPAAVAMVRSLPVVMWLVTYNGPDLATLDGATSYPLLMCFTKGRWFFATQRSDLIWITSLVVNGVPKAFGITSGATGAVFELFGDDTKTVIWKVQSKLYDFGAATTAKALMKVGVEFQAEAEVTPTMTVDSEFGSVTVNLTTSNVLQLIGNVGQLLTLTNTANDPLTLIGEGTILSRQSADLGGRYLGWTLQGQDVPFRLQAVQFEVVPTREWAA